MTLIIYGNKKSENCSKVDYVARYLKLDFEYKELDFEKDLKTQDYLKIHPAGKVPAVDDEGFVVFESNTICRYLCEKVKSDLYPEDLKRRTLVNQWMDFTSTQVSEALGRIFFGKDEAVKEDGLKALTRFLPILERELEKHTYLVGESLTLADIVLLASLRYLEYTKVILSEYPALEKWRKNMQTIPSFKESE